MKDYVIIKQGNDYLNRFEIVKLLQTNKEISFEIKEEKEPEFKLVSLKVFEDDVVGYKDAKSLNKIEIKHLDNLVDDYQKAQKQDPTNFFDNVGESYVDFLNRRGYVPYNFISEQFIEDIGAGAFRVSLNEGITEVNMFDLEVNTEHGYSLYLSFTYSNGKLHVDRASSVQATLEDACNNAMVSKEAILLLIEKIKPAVLDSLKIFMIEHKPNVYTEVNKKDIKDFYHAINIQKEA